MKWSEYSIRQRIEAQLALQGLTKLQLSERSGIHPTALSPLFRRLEVPRESHVQLGTLYRICEALGLTIAWTLTGEGFMYEAERQKAGTPLSQEAPADLPFVLMEASRPKRQPKPRKVKLPTRAPSLPNVRAERPAVAQKKGNGPRTR